MYIGEVVANGEVLEVQKSKYIHDRRLCIQLISTIEGPFGVLSVNVEDVELEENEFVVNHDWNGKWAISYLNDFLSSSLFEDTGKRCNYGFVKNQPIWRLNDRGRS